MELRIHDDTIPRDSMFLKWEAERQNRKLKVAIEGLKAIGSEQAKEILKKIERTK